MVNMQVPTTVFTPLEFAATGLTEERAAVQYGADSVQVCLKYACSDTVLRIDSECILIYGPNEGKR